VLTNIHCFFTRKSGKRLAPCARRKPRGPRPLRKRVCEEAVAGLGEAGTNRGQRRQRPRLQERRGVPSRSRRRRLDGCVPPRFQQLATGPGTRETARSEIAPRNHRQTGSLRGRAGSPSTPLQTKSAILRIAATVAHNSRGFRSRAVRRRLAGTASPHLPCFAIGLEGAARDLAHPHTPMPTHPHTLPAGSPLPAGCGVYLTVIAFSEAQRPWMLQNSVA
jgi:hypothetical protein